MIDFLNKNKLLPLLFLLLNINLFSQAGAYYDALNTSSSSFIDSLKSRIRNPYTRISYDLFDETNIANYVAKDNGNGTKSVFCVYSNYEHIYSGTFAWLPLSREHTWCQNWMPFSNQSSTDAYADQHHLFPAHQNNANAVRSDHPLGTVVSIISTFLEGKYGTNSNGKSVYEPRDKHKGDAARALLYMAVRYDGLNGYSWNFNYLKNKLQSIGEDSVNLATLLAWHKQDPPDKWEIGRNDYIQSIQKNRNPFIDHPEYVNFIDFYGLTKKNPSYAVEPSNYATNFGGNATGSIVNLNWTKAVAGSQAPTGYLLLAYNYNNYFLPMDGEIYQVDSNLTDGSALIYLDSSASSFSFSGLNNGTYYFTLFSYNGSGSSRNYKINSVLPQTNVTVTAALANTIVNFTTTSGSVNEASGTYNLSLSISNPNPTVATTVQVVLTSGNPADIGNYTTQTVTFPAGSSANQTLQITITNDTIPEGDEILTFSLQNISGGTNASIGPNNTFNLSIIDNDITTVSFATADTTLLENSGSYTFYVKITNPSNTQPTTVKVFLTSGSAVDINNYTTQTVTFPAGNSTQQPITILITDNSINDGNRSVEFSLDSISGGIFATIVAPSTKQITIIDDDISTISLFDNFNRANNNTIGNTLSTPALSWSEYETVSNGIRIESNRLKMSSSIMGREFAMVNLSDFTGYPVILKNSGSVLTWAFNMKQTRPDPSGFQDNRYGIAFILAKSSADSITGNGYAVIIGQDGSTDSIRLAKFSNGISRNSNFITITGGGDFGTEYISVKVTFNPITKSWSLFADTSSVDFPQSDPRNTTTQYGSNTVDSTYINTSLPFMGPLWKHNTVGTEFAIFDDIYITTPAIDTSITLNLTALIEGLWNGTKMIRDTVTVSLANASSPFTIIENKKVYLDSTGSGTVKFNNAPTGNYYIVLTHRSGIETWSQSGGIAMTRGTTSSYNFTTSASQAYGSNLKLIGSKYCIYSGDVNKDGQITLDDLLTVDMDNQNFETGYLVTDVNGDGQVDLSDLIIVDTNNQSFISVSRP